MRAVHTAREHDRLKPGPTLSAADIEELGGFARKVLKRRDGDLAASNHVGIVATSSGTVLEILPKIDLDDDPGYERTRRVFLQMLRRWRGLGARLRSSDIRALSRYPMLEVFVRQFLDRVTELTRHGLARRYVTVEENLPHLRGRIVFARQIRDNAANQAQFCVAHDELTVNRAANRLIRIALLRLAPRVRDCDNRQMLRQALVCLADVPPTPDVHADWRSHHVDRSMPHYRPVMQWVELFLFNHGLATFSGPHTNLSLLFPMEQVFEDFVTDSFRRYQQRYTVTAQRPQKPIATIDDRPAFMMKPDVLLRGSRAVFILDAKWKRLDTTRDYPRHRIDQGDLYQLHAYGSRYRSDAVALIYPRNHTFTGTLHYRFFDGRPLIAIPFDLTQPQASTERAVRALEALPAHRAR